MNMQDEIIKKPTNFSIFCWNIANPSPERAGRQAIWLRRRPEDILVLSEVKASKGCVLIERYLESFGYNIIFTRPIEKEYAVMIISKHPIESSKFAKMVKFIPSRLASVKINKLEIVGAYIPSRGFDEGSIMVRKRNFMENLSNALVKSCPIKKQIFCGDLNILEPNHIPHYPHFKQWEYDFYNNFPTKYQLHDAFRFLHPEDQEHSWVGHSGDGYRFDHCFVSRDLLSSVQRCYYLHGPREDKLSDHSGLIIELNL